MNNRLGIIGGGQLALYLCQAAQKIGTRVSVLSDTDDAPAVAQADVALVESLDSIPALDQFLASCDVVTFDKEDIPNETLNYLIEAERRGRVAVNPGTDILLLLKDKALQKTWLIEKGLPTLPFRILSGSKSSAAAEAGKQWPALVQKSRCGGYDGRGVQIIKSPAALQQLWNVPSIVEPFLADCREISVISSRSADGEIQTYPPVGMEFDTQFNSVDTVCMPAAINVDLSREAIELAEQAVAALQGVGVFAIEMFLTADNKLLINEISPRVHNSGHLTLDACNVSQFEQHVRAVLGMPLVAVQQRAAAAMLNILYSDALGNRCPGRPVTGQLRESQTTVYWYGKLPGKTGRKMGHINSLANDTGTAIMLARRALSGLCDKDGQHAA